jgi:hypothetical protein
MWINFPFVVNGDKYPVLDTELKKGTPYVQIIPFKRDSWRKKITTTKKIYSNFKYFSKIIHRYKQLIWSRKTWR